MVPIVSISYIPSAYYQPTHFRSCLFSLTALGFYALFLLSGREINPLQTGQYTVFYILHSVTHSGSI